MAKVERDIKIEASPDDVWGVVGDFGGISKWLGAIESSSIDGDTRVCAIAGGGELVEKILERDDENRRYSYTITESPFPLESHKAWMSVEPDGAGSKVTWVMEIAPDTVAQGMEPIAESGLVALKAYVEGS